MVGENLISETDAAAWAGLSPATLGRFAEAGYLRIERDPQGRRFFPRSDVAALFGLSDPRPRPPSAPESRAEAGAPAGGDAADEPREAQPQQSLPAEAAARARTVFQVFERILELREREIEDLKGERDWLKRRIEKLEEKSDRDQIVLLSETQMLRRMVLAGAARRSSWQLALEWLGISASASPQRSGAALEDKTPPQERKGKVYAINS